MIKTFSYLATWEAEIKGFLTHGMGHLKEILRSGKFNCFFDDFESFCSACRGRKSDDFWDCWCAAS
jgi:hypothetical protein